jgi:hypothetical protein
MRTDARGTCIWRAKLSSPSKIEGRGSLRWACPLCSFMEKFSFCKDIDPAVLEYVGKEWGKTKEKSKTGGKHGIYLEAGL